MDTVNTDLPELTAEVERLTLELAQSEARFRDIIERNADAIVVVDREGVIRFVNDQAVKLFGRKRQPMLGTPFGFPLVAGETTELDLLRDRDPVVVEMRVVESQWQGESACIASLRDITERKGAEQHARDLIRAEAARAVAERAARKFRFLAESTTLLSSSLDYAATLAELARLCVTELADWVVIYTFEDDQVRRLEVAHRDASRTELVRALHDYPLTNAHPVFELIKTRRPQLSKRIDASELDAQLKDPEYAELVRALGFESSRLVPMVARERALGAIGFVRSTAPFDEEDLTLAIDLASRAALAIDNARLYADARAANQTKTELLAMISHDLRTPLNSIIGYGQLLQMGIPEQLSTGTRERIDRMLASAKHQLYLIDELLQFARLDAKQEHLQLQDIELQNVVREAVALIEPLAIQRRLAVRVSMPPAQQKLHTDPNKLRQVLINLIANAVKYTEHGDVTVEARNDSAKTVEISVRDTGVGIAPEDLPHIFEPFWQADRSQRARGGGTGLGLNVVEQIVHLLGGQISVRSEPGRGSTFTVTLPLAPSQAQ
jgi:signal transduction histidine kinase